MLYLYRNLWHLYYSPPLSIEPKKKQTEETTQFLFMFYMHNVKWTM